MKLTPSSIGFKSATTGEVTDTKLHDEIMIGVDDSALRQLSAQNAIEKMGISPTEAEDLFGVC